MKFASLTNEDIKQIMLDSGVIEAEEIDVAEKCATQKKMSLADAILEQGLISAEEITKLIADNLNLPFVSLSAIPLVPEILAIIPEIVARKNKLVPFKRDNEGLHLAMADPTNIEIINFIKRKEGAIVVHIATEQDIDARLELYGKKLEDDLDEVFCGLDIASSEKEKKESDDFLIIRALKKIILQAYRNRASDIHLEPREEGDSIVRFRIDGVLHDTATIPRHLHPQVISRIKVLSKLRTDEHQVPQDGKMEFQVEEIKSEIDIRVSIVPITEGEKAVMRLLSERSRQFALANIGLDRDDLEKIKKAYNKPYGMLLATGPTGCGKTTTLYAILKILNQRRINIVTIEDPVEYDIEGVNQIQVNPAANLTFATGLRSILRQDPDIILVGEIRDKETADIAVNLALTGHLVLSTLHTNDSATAIPRFVDLGIEPFLISSTINIIIAQRLVRKIHNNCRISEEVTAEKIAEKIGWNLTAKFFGGKETEPEKIIRLYRGKGCDSCQQTGFQGRIGIFEVLSADDRLRQAINQNQDAENLRILAAKAGMKTMIEDGLEKAKAGTTTIDEVLGATKT